MESAESSSQSRGIGDVNSFTAREYVDTLSLIQVRKRAKRWLILARHSQLIDPTITRWYHRVSRCVRRAFLLSEGPDDRRKWVENRLEELAGIFAIAVGGFSVVDNHLHVLVRLDQDVAKSWSDEEVVRRWGRLYPPRDKSGEGLPVPEA